MKIVREDDAGKFILIKLRSFCNEKSIAIKYKAPYVYKKNGWIKQELRTIVTIKDLILINSRLPNCFWADIIETANYLQNRLLIKSRNYDKMISEEL